MRYLRLAAELALDGLLIALVVALVAHGRRPAPPALNLAHDPLRCSACTHPNARVTAEDLVARVSEDGETASR